MSDDNSSSGPSATGLFLGVASLAAGVSDSLFLSVASFAAGAYHGYMDRQGIPIEKENLEWALTYGPALVQGGLGATIGGVVGLIGSGAVGATPGWRYSALEKIAKGTGGAVIGTVAGAGLGGVAGGFKTLFGYGIGYVVGSL